MQGFLPQTRGVTLQFYKLGIYKTNEEQYDGTKTTVRYIWLASKIQ